MDEQINHGVILGQRPEDWVAGSVSGLTYEVINPSGDWRPYLPTKEIQFGREDSMACVSFSLINAIEIQEKFLTGKETNYSDRFLAKRSDTTQFGNYLYKVADVVRKEGIVKETSYPTLPNYTFAEYYAEIKEPLLTDLLIEGKQWLERFTFNYEFIPLDKAELLKHIKQAPLQVVIPGHAVVGFLCEQDIINYFDTYSPHEKTTPYSMVQAVLKPVLKLKNMTNVKLIKNGSEFAYYVPATSEEALIDKALNFGYPLPTLDNGKRVDWSKIKPDFTL